MIFLGLAYAGRRFFPDVGMRPVPDVGQYAQHLLFYKISVDFDVADY